MESVPLEIRCEGLAYFDCNKNYVTVKFSEFGPHVRVDDADLQWDGLHLMVRPDTDRTGIVWALWRYGEEAPLWAGIGVYGLGGPGPDGLGVLPEDVEALRTVLKEFLWGDVKRAASAPFPDVDLITAVNDAPAGSDLE